jgi:hypothetical protein
MKKMVSLSLVLILAAAAALAHAGHAHTYMGSVTTLRDDGGFTMKTTEEKEVAVQTSRDTVFTQADGRAVTRAELVVGMRVVVKMSQDGKTAASVKMSPAKA